MACNGSFKPSGGTAQQASWVQSMERRMAALETQQRLFSSSVKGGALQVLTDDGAEVGRFGLGSFSTYAGIREVPVLSVQNSVDSNFMLLIDTEEGWNSPYNCLTFQENTYVPVTNSSFVNCWKSVVSITAKVLYFSAICSADSATVGEIRLDMAGNQTDPITLAAGAFTPVLFKWDVSDLVSFSEVHFLGVQGRRVSGSGNVNIYSPNEVFLDVISNQPDATESGIPSS